MPSFLGYPYINPITIVSNQPSFTSDTINLKRQSVRTGAQRWDLSINFRAGLNSSIFGDLMAHYTVNGEGTPFDIEVPQNPGVLREYSVSNIPTTNGGEVAGSTEITIDTGTFVYPAGLFVVFNVSGHDKVYMVTETLNGGSTLKITPPLTEAVADNVQILGGDIDMRVYHNAPNSVNTYAANGTQGVTWSFVEAL